MAKLAPSILSADFANLERDVLQIEKGGADFVHCDVMDGQFVPEITYGQPVVRTIRKLTKLPFDVHLMTLNPEKQIESFAEAGADWITFHIEATAHAHRLIQMIHEKGKKAGIAICPATPVSALSEILECVDLVLVMSVEPGEGGQSFNEITYSRIKELLVTNTIPMCEEKRKQVKKIKIISVGLMLARIIAAISTHTPVSEVYGLFSAGEHEQTKII